MNMTHDIYFGNLHEDTVGEAYLDLPNKVLARPLVFLFQSLRSRKENPMAGSDIDAIQIKTWTHKEISVKRSGMERWSGSEWKRSV